MTMSMESAIPLEADYVVIGGGTSGLVLASRLSEDSTKSIIILEAGKNLINDPRVQIPALWTTLAGSEADWQLQTTPQVSLFTCTRVDNTDSVMMLTLHPGCLGASSRP